LKHLKLPEAAAAADLHKFIYFSPHDSTTRKRGGDDIHINITHDGQKQHYSAGHHHFNKRRMNCGLLFFC